MRQGYRDVDDELPYVRGRIDIGALRPGREKPCQVPCRFSGSVVDTLENPIVRETMELLATAALCASVRRRLRDTLSAFVQVSLVRLTAQMFDRVHHDRLNAFASALIVQGAYCPLVSSVDGCGRSAVRRQRGSSQRAGGHSA